MCEFTINEMEFFLINENWIEFIKSGEQNSGITEHHKQYICQVLHDQLMSEFISSPSMCWFTLMIFHEICDGHKSS